MSKTLEFYNLKRIRLYWIEKAFVNISELYDVTDAKIEEFKTYNSELRSLYRTIKESKDFEEVMNLKEPTKPTYE